MHALFLKPALALLTASCATTVSAAPVSVGQFNICADLPPGYVIGPPPTNDDGRSFDLGGGYTLSLWGAHVVEETLQDYQAERALFMGMRGEMTYAPMGEDWFVLSGTADGEVVYMRVEQGIGPGGGRIWVHMEAVYPANGPDRAAHDALTADIAGSLGDC